MTQGGEAGPPGAPRGMTCTREEQDRLGSAPPRATPSRGASDAAPKNLGSSKNRQPHKPRPPLAPHATSETPKRPAGAETNTAESGARGEAGCQGTLERTK